MKKQILLLMMIALLSITLVSAREVTCSDNGIVSLYHFEDGSGTTLTDSCGVNDCVLIGTEDWTSEGKFNGAFNFNHIDNFFRCGEDNSLSFGTGNFSVSAWIKSTSNFGSDEGIVDFYDGIDDYEYGLFTSSGDNGIYWYLSDNFNYPDVAYTSPINNGSWYFIVGVREGQRIVLYINGVLVAEDNSTGLDNITISYTNMTIGTFSRLETASSYGFNGTIDDVAIWDKALSQEEIENIYAEEVVVVENTGLIQGSGDIFSLMNTAGAGLGIFIQTMAIALPPLLIIIALIGIIIAVGFAISNLIKNSDFNKK